jgi:pimeloyl-ACP methyl ester carboxylesterase
MPRQPSTEGKRGLSDAEAGLFARYGIDPRVRTVTLRTPPISLGVCETGSGEPALLMHGITLSTVHWAPLMARLGSLRCIAIDMPGHGRSSSVDFTGVDLRSWHTTMLQASLDALGLRSAHMIGHSYAGMFALWLALDAPERVRSVISIGTPSVGLGARPDVLFKMLAVPGIGRSVLALPSPLPVYRRLLARALGRPALQASPPELVRATYLASRRPGLAMTASSYLREQFRGMRATPQRYVLDDSELAGIRPPVLVIWGDRDTRYQPIAEGRRKTELIPGARFGLVTGGHEPWLDDADACAKLITQFLADVSTHPQRNPPS